MRRVGFMRSAWLLGALCATILFLAACDSAEERAEAHYQTGLALLAEGDVDRALIEFRNVFKLNGQHKDARLTYARLERERGNISGSYGQYLRLIEQYPDNLEGQRALAEMALETGNLEDVGRHATAAAQLAPDDIEIQSILNTLSYSEAVRQNNVADAEFAVHQARSLLEADPLLMTARQVLIDFLIRNQDWEDALDEIDAALRVDPERGNLYALRLGALQELDRTDEIEALLLLMSEQFPDDEGVKQMLVQHYIDYKELDAAEQFLRADIDDAAPDHIAVQRLIAFLDQYRGAQAAIDEMDRIIVPTEPDNARFKSMRAVLKFRAGDAQTATDEMRALLEGADRTIETRDIEVEFARLLFQTGNPTEARALVETILEEDPTQVNALKFKSAWLIEEDETGEAIILLREALGQSPRDPQLMTLMAQAHERNGNRELMGEMLALAVEVSLKAPEESLRSARFLIAEGDLTIAERVLVHALRLAPENTDLLLALGQLYLQTEDWERLDAVLRTLETLDDPNAEGLTTQLKVQMLSAQDRASELTAFLDQLTEDPEFGLSAEVALIRSELLRGGDISTALAQLNELLKGRPDSQPLKFLKAHILAATGKPDEAESLYRAILKIQPGATSVWGALHALHLAQGAPEKARAVLEDALNALPDEPNLLLLQAADYERAREIDKAIEVYEKLYAYNSQSRIVANNLASLLTTHRTDDESLQRAVTLARRLRGAKVPAFQDTYGWVTYRMGNYEEALRYLETAAAALPNEPLVLYHLAKTYAALDRDEEALRNYQAALDLDSPLNVTPTLGAEIERLTAEPAVKQ